MYWDHASQGTGDSSPQDGDAAEGANLNKDALADYMRSFNGPLTQQAIVMLSSLFKLDCHLTAQVDDALTDHDGLGMLGAEGMDVAHTRERVAPPLAGANPGVLAAGLAAT